MNILAVFAHPDDETMLCGGSLAWMAALGAQVHYLCATSGEGGEMGEPPICTRQDLGAVRRAELACAVHALGGTSLQFLDYVDPEVGENDTLFAFDATPEELAKKLLDCLEVLNINAIITHGSQGEYGHPAHRLVHQAAQLAVSSIKFNPPLLYTVQASFPEHPKPRLMNVNDPAHLILDLGPMMAKKIAATLCHRTQHALFIRRSSIAAGRTLSIPEIVIGIESLHRAHPPVQDSLDDSLAQLLLTNPCIRRANER